MSHPTFQCCKRPDMCYRFENLTGLSIVCLKDRIPILICMCSVWAHQRLIECYASVIGCGLMILIGTNMHKSKLVEVPGGEKVDERIYDPLMEMLEAAKEGNWNQLPMVVSGYRTQKKQQQLYDDKVAGYRKEGNSQSEAEKLAKQWVSVPGYSEHQIGLAVDINGATYDLYSWLQENSYKYGFIFRYPGDKTDITGVAEEVWHYRYVGVEAATEMYEKGLCLEEYLAERQAEQ